MLRWLWGGGDPVGFQVEAEEKDNLELSVRLIFPRETGFAQRARELLSSHVGMFFQKPSGHRQTDGRGRTA